MLVWKLIRPSTASKAPGFVVSLSRRLPAFWKLGYAIWRTLRPTGRQKFGKSLLLWMPKFYWSSADCMRRQFQNRVRFRMHNSWPSWINNRCLLQIWTTPRNAFYFWSQSRWTLHASLAYQITAWPYARLEKNTTGMWNTSWMVTTWKNVEHLLDGNHMEKCLVQQIIKGWRINQI